MARKDRLETLISWWKEKNHSDYERAREAGIRDVRVDSENEELWYSRMKEIALVTLERESKKRWAVSDATAKDYASTVLSNLDGPVRILAKLMAKERNS